MSHKSRLAVAASLFAIAASAAIEPISPVDGATFTMLTEQQRKIMAIPSYAERLATLKADEYCMENCRRVVEIRRKTVDRLRLLGFEVLDSRANFVFARRPGSDGGWLYRELKARGVLVRHFETPRIRDYLRITIGTPAQMDVLFEKLEEITKQPITQ